jgi:hypothetical protein
METLTNIGPDECRKRLTWGIGFLAFSLFYFAALVQFRLGQFWWLGLFLTAFIGVLGILQALEKTCVALAAGGYCIPGPGGRKTKILDGAQVRGLRRKGTRVLINAVVLGLLFVFLAKMVPRD